MSFGLINPMPEGSARPFPKPKGLANTHACTPSKADGRAQLLLTIWMGHHALRRQLANWCERLGPKETNAT